jgi:4-methyl-5(b-hydroxyethyl)-thiazole monophosphate biosynthesis
MKRIAVLLKDGFEEVEAIVPIDVLRRLDFEVILVGDSERVAGAHGVEIATDVTMAEMDASNLDAVMLPGGMPGSTNLRDDPEVLDLIRTLYSSGKIVAAICAAPIALAEAGIIAGKRCTGYPMELVEQALANANYTRSPVEIDGNVVTGKGPGAAFDFALALATALGAEPQARSLYKNMFVGRL